jgi:hypothetical protein
VPSPPVPPAARPLAVLRLAVRGGAPVVARNISSGFWWVLMGFNGVLICLNGDLMEI